jgi:hypothetical protein
MSRTTARIASVLTAGLTVILAGAGAASADEPPNVSVTYTGTAQVELTTWAQCADEPPVKVGDESLTVDVALVVAGVDTGTDHVEFIFGSPEPAGEGTFVVATGDGGGQEFWTTTYDDATGLVIGEMEPSAVGASPLYNIVRSEQPYTQCGSSDTAEATQPIGSDAQMAGYINATSAALTVFGSSADGRTEFSVVATGLRPDGS